MKKYLFGAMVVGVAFTSCVNDLEADLAAESNAKPISFEVAKYKASSRADESVLSSTSTSVYPTTGFFGTFGVYAAERNGEHSVFVNQDSTMMQNSKVGFANRVWTVLSDTYFWPQTGHVDFVSYSPYSTDVTKVPVVGHVNESAKDYNALSFTDYTVTTDDLMYSDKAHLQHHNKVTYHQSGVPTLFRHALAKLNFKVEAAYVISEEKVGETVKEIHWQVVVKSIKLANIYDKGSLILHTTSPTGTEATTTQYEIANYSAGDYRVWTRQASQTSKEWAPASGQLLTVNATDFSDAINYFVLPQTFTAGEQSITITYTISNRVGDGSYDAPTEFTKKLYFDDYDSSVKAWEMGKNITYTILIDPKGDVINFDPTVADWEDVNGTLGI